jgi:hypothetical protein
MADYLDPDAAKKIAKTLKLIPGFPWDEEALEEAASDLGRWCTGAIIDNRVWPAEAQARAIVQEARLTWEKWQGMAALYAIFRAMFETAPPKLRFPVFEGLQKPPIECRRCEDTGTVTDSRGAIVYCGCDQGEAMEADPELGARWLQVLNRSAERSRMLKRPASTSEVRAFLRLPPVVEIDESYRVARERIAGEIAKAEAVLADETATGELKEMAAEVIRTYSGESKKKKAKARLPWQI